MSQHDTFDLEIKGGLLKYVSLSIDFAFYEA